MNGIEYDNDYILDRENETLRHGNREIELRPKLFEMLDYLINNPNRLLTRGELLKNVWPDVYVCPEIVKSSVRDLRKLLNDDPKAPRFIETKHGRGYRFVGAIKIKPADKENHPPAVNGAVYYF